MSVLARLPLPLRLEASEGTLAGLARDLDGQLDGPLPAGMSDSTLR